MLFFLFLWMVSLHLYLCVLTNYEGDPHPTLTKLLFCFISYEWNLLNFIVNHNWSLKRGEFHPICPPFHSASKTVFFLKKKDSYAPCLLSWQTVKTELLFFSALCFCVSMGNPAFILFIYLFSKLIFSWCKSSSHTSLINLRPTMYSHKAFPHLKFPPV